MSQLSNRPRKQLGARKAKAQSIVDDGGVVLIAMSNGEPNASANLRIKCGTHQHKQDLWSASQLPFWKAGVPACSAQNSMEQRTSIVKGLKLGPMAVLTGIPLVVQLICRSSHTPNKGEGFARRCYHRLWGAHLCGSFKASPG